MALTSQPKASKQLSLPVLEIESLSKNNVSLEEYPSFNPNTTESTKNISENNLKLASLSNMSYLLDKLLSEEVYDKRIRPEFGGKPLEIYTDIEIRSFGPISENEMIYSMDCYFRQTWIDPRLKFGEYEENKILLVLSMDWKFLERVWIPDTSIFNGRNSYMHKVTVPNKFIRVRQDGQLRYSMRITIKASCPMHLRKYPFDVQSCGLQIGSFAYTSKDLLYRWKGQTPVVISNDVTLSQYNFVNITPKNISKSVSFSDERSSIIVRFILQRRRGYFMLQIYAPCAMIVGASWVSFWINRSDAAGRVSVGATTVLTLVTMGFGGQSSSPRVTYPTALDWFIVMCFAFVFIAMVEYACVNFVDHKQAEQIQRIFNEKLRKHQIKAKSKTKFKEKRNIGEDIEEEVQQKVVLTEDKDEIIVTETDAKVDVEFVIETENAKQCEELTENLKTEEIKKDSPISLKSLSLKEMPIKQLARLEPTRGKMLDEWARKAFPFTFVILNLIYWVLFLYTFDDELDLDLENTHNSHRIS